VTTNRFPSGAAGFAKRHPVVWHVIETEGLDSALLHGLLSATALRRQAGVPGTAANRDDYEHLKLPDGGSVLLRFQQMLDAKLLPSLMGQFAEQPAAWRGHINSHVFFWADAGRRDGFIKANARERARSSTAPSTVSAVTLAFDTANLLEQVEDLAFYSTINTGSTVRGGARARRDENTFQPITAYRSGLAAELAIRGAVPPEVLAAAKRDSA